MGRRYGLEGCESVLLELHGVGRGDASDVADDLLTVAEACAELRVSKWTLYRYIHSRQLASVKLRSRRLIPRSAIRALIEKLTIKAIA